MFIEITGVFSFFIKKMLKNTNNSSWTIPRETECNFLISYFIQYYGVYSMQLKVTCILLKYLNLPHKKELRWNPPIIRVFSGNNYVPK